MYTICIWIFHWIIAKDTDRNRYGFGLDAVHAMIRVVDACDKNDNFIEQHSSKRWGDFDNLLDVFEGLKNRLYFVRNFDISLSVPSGKESPFYSLELWKVVFVAYTKRLSAFITSIH